MTKTLLVATREFIETVKTKAFVFGAIIMPFVMIALILAVGKFMKLGESEKLPLRTIGVNDETGGAVLTELQALAAESNQNEPNRPIEFVARPPTDDRGRALVEQGELYAYLTIPAGVLTPLGVAAPPAASPETTTPPPASAPAVPPAGPELTRTSSRMQEVRQFERLLQEAVVRVRFQQAEPPIDRARILMLEQDVHLEAVDARTGDRSGSRDISRMLMPFVFMFLLWMGTFGISQGLLTSVIEEKSSRVMEVLLSAVSPLELMAGKVVGMVGVGALLIVVWLLVGRFASDSLGMPGLLTTDRIFLFIMYFAPAFLLYAAMLGGIGAAFNTLKEAQAMMSPLALITTIPMMLWFVVSQYPQSPVSVIASFFPPITPFIMILRICSDAATPTWQIVATLVLLWISVFIALWAAAKIFRVGILMYGKPPSPDELLRWIREA